MALDPARRTDPFTISMSERIGSMAKAKTTAPFPFYSAEKWQLARLVSLPRGCLP